MKFAGKNSIPYEKYEDLLKNKKITHLIGSEVNKKNRDFASYESVKNFQIVPEFTIENGLLTPTLKPKRNKVFDKYENEIKSMYASG
jgi:long-chain acyl-CoA synthetase